MDRQDEQDDSVRTYPARPCCTSPPEGQVKTIETLTGEEEKAAAIFRALGNPARVRIVTELAKRSSCVTGELVELLPLAQSTVSQHLKVLKEAGIIRGTVDGDSPSYCLDPEAILWLTDFCRDVCCPPGDCDVDCAGEERSSSGR